MNNKCRRQLLIRSVWMLMLSSAWAQAGTISYTGTTVSGALNEGFSIPQFDPTGGRQLTSIDFTFTATLSTYIYVATGSPVTVSYSTDTSILVPNITPDPLLQLVVYEPISGSFVAHPGSNPFLAATRTGTSSLHLVPGPLAAALYTGQGTVDLGILFSEFGPDFLAPGPQVLPSGAIDTSWVAHLQVDYNYNDIPEPAMLWLVASGCCAAWLRARRQAR